MKPTKPLRFGGQLSHQLKDWLCSKQTNQLININWTEVSQPSFCYNQQNFLTYLYSNILISSNKCCIKLVLNLLTISLEFSPKKVYTIWWTKLLSKFLWYFRFMLIVNIVTTNMILYSLGPNIHTNITGAMRTKIFKKKLWHNANSKLANSNYHYYNKKSLNLTFNSWYFSYRYMSSGR